MTRLDREDLSAQRDRVTETENALRRDLAALADSAKPARSRLNLDRVHEEYRAVCRSEEAWELAKYDLATASGEDG